MIDFDINIIIILKLINNINDIIIIMIMITFILKKKL